MSEDLLESLACEGQLVHVEQHPRPSDSHGPLVDPLSDAVWKRLGIDALWCHQAEAIDLLGGRRIVVVATGTASGKSLCYQAADRRGGGRRRPPAPRCSVPDQGARPGPAALARARWLVPGCVAVTYDGDTAPDDRAWVAQATPTSCSPTPRCCTAASCRPRSGGPTFLMRLRYVVVDELHTLRGIFGSHVAHRAAPAATGRARTTGRRRRSASRRRRSASPAELASALCGLAGRAPSTTTARRGASACFALLATRRCSTRTPGRRGVGQRRDRRADRRAS